MDLNWANIWVNIYVCVCIRRNPSLIVTCVLGVPLYPLYKPLIPLLDVFASELQEDIAPIVISSPHLIPSTRFRNARYPLSLPRHLLSLISSSRPSPIRQATDKTINSSPNPTEPIENEQSISKSPGPTPPDPSTAVASSNGNFLGMPAVSVNVPNMNMDVRKWGWPGVLTFGRNQGKKVHTRLKSEGGPEPKGKEIPKQGDETEDAQAVSVTVDTSSLEDAMASDARSVVAASVTVNVPSATVLPQVLPIPDSYGATEPDAGTEDHISPIGQSAIDLNLMSANAALPNNEISSSGPVHLQDETPLPSQTSLLAPTPELSSTMVRIPVGEDSLVTEWRKILYLRVGFSPLSSLFHSIKRVNVARTII
jgi:hypothetical protein